MSYVVEASERIEAPREAVWRLMTDSARYAEWGIWDRSVVEKAGAAETDGVGAVRALTQGRRTVREEITAFEPCEVYEYRLLSGIPIRDYRARVTLQADGDETVLTWRSTYDALPVLGGLVRQRLQSAITEVVGRLAARAAADSR